MLLESKIQDVLFIDLEIDSAGFLPGSFQSLSNARILCICVGKIGKDNKVDFLKLRCFYNENEQNLLIEFNSFLQKLSENTLIYAHNGKEFNLQFLRNRMLKYQIAQSEVLNPSTQNITELDLLDSQKLEELSGNKQFTSLEFLSFLFKIDSFTTKIEESKYIGEYYYQNELQRMIDYCYKNIVTIAQLLLRFNNQNTIRTENIYYV